MHSRARVIRADGRGAPILQPRNGEGLDLVYFDVVQLAPGEEHTIDFPGVEFHLVPLSGRMDVKIDDHNFEGVGGRDSVWHGTADSLYAGSGSPIKVTALTQLELVVAGGVTDGRFAPFRVTPEDVHCVEVGSSETKSHRRICHLLGQNAAGRAGNLLVSELYAEEGCWSGYPPHKHDTDQSERDDKGVDRLIETDHEELYHFRYRPESGFGAQFNYHDDEPPRVEMVRHGDSVLIPGGYHPTVTSPGHQEYIFTVLVGRTRRGLIQRFEADHFHLLAGIPGIADMQKAFERTIASVSKFRIQNLWPWRRSRQSVKPHST